MYVVFFVVAVKLVWVIFVIYLSRKNVIIRALVTFNYRCKG